MILGYATYGAYNLLYIKGEVYKYMLTFMFLRVRYFYEEYIASKMSILISTQLIYTFFMKSY